jgi:hypothetical protein
MAALTRALAVTLQVDGKCPHVVGCHASGEAVIASRMLAEAVYDSESDACAGMRPCPVRDLASPGGLYESVGCDGVLRRQDARSPSGS